MTEKHAKKRLELIIETPYLNLLLDELEASDVPGYTVLPALAGKGHHGTWRRDGHVTSAGIMVSVVCILDEARLDPLLARLRRILDRQIGIVSVGDVEVLRGDHF